LTSIAATQDNQPRFDKGLRHWLLSYMPDQPFDQPEPNLNRHEVRTKHYLYGVAWSLVILAMLAGALAISKVMIYSPIYIAALGVHAVLGFVPTEDVNDVLYAVFLYVLLKRVETLGVNNESEEDLGEDTHEEKGFLKLGNFWSGLATAAMVEEQVFREGSEEWSTWERIKSCAIFSVMHLWNLFIPLGAIIPLATAGGYLMRRYLVSYEQTESRERAVVESARYHYAYNRVVLTGSVVVSAAYILVTQLFSVHLF
jgi:hypothetical protein